MAYKNDERERDNNDWEHVSFFLPAFEESDWYVRYRSNTNFQDNFCADQLDDNNLTDGVWTVKDNYWDSKGRRLLIDVTRPMEFPEGNQWNAKTLEFDKELQVLV